MNMWMNKWEQISEEKTILSFWHRLPLTKLFCFVSISGLYLVSLQFFVCFFCLSPFFFSFFFLFFFCFVCTDQFGLYILSCSSYNIICSYLFCSYIFDWGVCFCNDLKQKEAKSDRAESTKHGSYLAIERRHTNSTNTWVAYKNSPLVCKWIQGT